jgi:hypothetical protein
VTPPRKPLSEDVYTPAEALRSAEGLQRAIDSGHKYLPLHKYDAIRTRIAYLRSWANQELN